MGKGKRVNVPRRAAKVKNDGPERGGKRSARPKLGQHFLADEGAAEQVVAALGDLSERTVVEIGPGRGALTSRLAARARRVIAIELDRVLSAQLRLRFSQTPNLEILEGDVLAIDFCNLLGPKPGLSRPGLVHDLERALVVGNLPYYITSDILLHLFASHRCLDTLVLMVQREVADRLAASPGTRDYGLLTATARLYGQVETLFTLPPGAFQPPPKVHSAVVRIVIEPQLERLGVPADEFQDFLRLSFGQKRKTLWNNLKTRYQPASLTPALRRAGLQPRLRAEAVPLEKMAALYRGLTSAAAGGPP